MNCLRRHMCWKSKRFCWEGAPAYRFLRKQVRWSGMPISLRIFQFVVIHTAKGFGIVSDAEVDVFLELSCFFYDPADVGKLISDSSAFLKSSLNIWDSSGHLLLKPSLKNFEFYFASIWDECNYAVVWTFFVIVFLWDWKKKEMQCHVNLILEFLNKQSPLS